MLRYADGSTLTAESEEYIYINFNLLYLSYYFELHEWLEMKKGILKSSTAIWLYQAFLCFKLFLDFTFQCS